MIRSFEAILVVNACTTNNTNNKQGSHHARQGTPLLRPRPAFPMRRHLLPCVASPPAFSTSPACCVSYEYLAVASPAIGAGAHSPSARFSTRNAPAALQCCALHRTGPRSAAHRPELYALLLFASLSRRWPRRSCRPGSALPSPCQCQPPAGALFLRYQALSLTARIVRPCPQAPRRAPASPTATTPLPAAGKCVRFVPRKVVP